MKTQQLKEELQGWQEHYSDPADKDNYDFFATVIAAIEQLEAAESRLHEVAVACATTEHELEETKQLLRGTREKLTRAIDRNVAKDIEIKRLSAVERERDELKRNQELNLKIKQAMHERFTRAEAELARRDAAAGEPVGLQCMGDNGKWQDCASREVAESHGFTIFRELYAAAPPAVLRDIEPLIEGALKLHGLRTAVDGHSQLSDGFRNGARWAAKELGAQQQKPVVLPAERFCAAEHAGSLLWTETEVWNKAIYACATSLDAANVPYEVAK
ncbi:hypothetical protein FVB43_18805 [Erwinia rhapontici]|uniref:hypothetical protein n=1 Tax=Erwinia rhapontici TaxID=55212 RepID=UPI00143849A4|nr:hypothetical protein [Erwinia rhapontici]NKG32081.1 hypothetical protein [Erwinia rhapontici]